MQRVQSDDACAARRPLRRQPLQISEIADAPVATGAQGVELNRRAPDTGPFGERGREVAALRRRDQQRLAEKAAAPRRVVQLEAVVAGRQRGREFDVSVGLRLGGRVQLAFVARAVLQRQAPDETLARFRHGEMRAQAPRRAPGRHAHHGRQHFLRGSGAQRAFGRQRALGRARVDVQLKQQRNEALLRDFAPAAEDVVVPRSEPAQRAQAFERRARLAHGSSRLT